MKYLGHEILLLCYEIEECFAKVFGHVFGLADGPKRAVILLCLRNIGILIGFLVFPAFMGFSAIFHDVLVELVLRVVVFGSIRVVLSAVIAFFAVGFLGWRKLDELLDELYVSEELVVDLVAESHYFQVAFVKQHGLIYDIKTIIAGIGGLALGRWWIVFCLIFGWLFHGRTAVELYNYLQYYYISKLSP